MGMPYRSKKQQRWMHANEPEMAREWDAETDFSKLPEQAPKKPRRKRAGLKEWAKGPDRR
jgi:hypothetical protein